MFPSPNLVPCFPLYFVQLRAPDIPFYSVTGINTLLSFWSEVDMTTRQSDVARNLLYVAWPPIYGFVIEKEFPASLFSALPQATMCRRAL